ncbi:hypothetical protein Tco_0953282 [Tanacetum coccineum]|uniref:Uncharacterized protein n=1 Tax=Tanacetum coccineum TaxID=301880 RepID=A0ABQ5E1Q9_9ASTR
MLLPCAPSKINKSYNDQPQVKTQTVNEDGTPPRKGIKSPSKLLSPKYQYQSSLGEQNKNSTSPKRVHFVNTIIVLSKDDKPGEKGIVKPGIKDDDRDTIVKIKEECKESEEKGKEENGDPKNINANWNEYLRKGRKTKPKRQNRTRNGKDYEGQSQIEAEKSIKSKSQQKSQLVKVKVNPSQPRGQKSKKYKFREM